MSIKGEIICEWLPCPKDKEWGMQLLTVTSSDVNHKSGQCFKLGDLIKSAKLGFVVTILPLEEKQC